MRNHRQRNADVKLIVAATIAVLLAGFVIGAGIFVAVNSGDRVTCGTLPVGDAETIRGDLEHGPSFYSGGANCGFWLALDEGDVVAYKTDQANGCELNANRKQLVCGDTPADLDALAQFPVSIVSIDDVDTVIVDLTGRAETSTTTSTTTSTSTVAPS